MQNLIQLLKDNEKPFGLMSAEMQEAMRQIGKNGFERYFARGNGTWGEHDMTSRVFLHDTAYRLRPDYEDEPEIVECEIYPDEKDGLLTYMRKDNPTFLIAAADDPNFIGFKFKDGTVAIAPSRPMLIPTSPRGFSASFDEIKAIQDFMYATHVLFRRKKQE